MAIKILCLMRDKVKDIRSKENEKIQSIYKK